MTIFIQKSEGHACHGLPHMESPTACHLRLKIQFQKETRFLLILKKDEVAVQISIHFLPPATETAPLRRLTGKSAVLPS